MLRSRKKTRKQSASFGYQNLEQRQLLAFNFLSDGSTLTLNQSADDGVIFIDNSGPANEFRVNDGAGFVTYEAADNLVINLMDNSSHLTIALNTPHVGDLTINAGEGARNIVFASATNSLDGQLTINAGAGDQVVSLAQIAGLQVAESIVIDAGKGADVLQATNSVVVGDNLELTGVNDANFDGELAVNGDVTIDNTGETEISSFTSIGAPSSIGGRFTYFGGEEVDKVSLSQVEITGDMNVFYGPGITAGAEAQLLTLHNVTMNNMLFQSGDSSNFDFVLFSGTHTNGDVVLDFGEGDNYSSLAGKFFGSSFEYSGGSGIDSVIYALTGITGHDVISSLGDGNDEFDLFDGQSVNTLDIDFGNGDDFFNHSDTSFTFDANLKNLDAVDIRYDLAIDTLSVDQRDDAILTNVTLLNSLVTQQFTHSGNDLTDASNLEISMADNNLGKLTLFIDHGLEGDLRIDTGHGDRVIEFRGSANGIAGDFEFISGDRQQSLLVDDVAAFLVGGDSSIDMGKGDDQFAVTQTYLSTGTLDLKNVNQILFSGSLFTGSDFSVDVSNDDHSTYLELVDGYAIDGDFAFFGTDQHDESIVLSSAFAAVVTGNLFVDFGDNVDATSSQFFVLDNMNLNGNLTMLATSEGALDLFRTKANASISGDINVELGNGSNTTWFWHEVKGEGTFRYVGGSGDDEILLATKGLPTNYNAILGEGDDDLRLEASVEIEKMLRVDFGGGADAFTNNKGDFAWDTRLLNFQGFNNYYDPVKDQLRIVQTQDTLDFSVSNNHLSEAFKVDFKDGSGYELTPAANLRIHLSNETTTGMGVDLGKALQGNLILNLGQNDHEVRFIGLNNLIEGDLRVNGGVGDQNLHLADNNGLTVNGAVMINLRDGVDSVFDSGNYVAVAKNLTLRNVDNFEVTDVLTVGENMTVASLWFTQDVSFDNDGEIQIAGKFRYLGGDGSDQVLLGGNTSIGDDIFINLKDNISNGMNQTVDLSNGFSASGRIAIKGGDSMAGNMVITDASTFVGGDFVVDFSGSTTSNAATFKGQYGGGYGSFRGGDSDDTLIFDAIAEDMHWSTLMHGGSDEITLENSSNVLSKHLDFGLGDDLFEDFSVEDFPLSIVNFP